MSVHAAAKQINATARGGNDVSLAAICLQALECSETIQEHQQDIAWSST